MKKKKKDNISFKEEVLNIFSNRLKLNFLIFK